ncbi:hypothetical protein HON15_00305 [Candidatus Woesearchaeota archaeon]|nr:hypothetical protein [Candidatus Woesearchaeota archaeon]
MANQVIENTKKTGDNECLELKHIQYKSMIQTGVPCSMEYGKDNVRQLNNLEKFLEQAPATENTEGWNKLDMTVKMQKVHEFILKYAEDNCLEESESVVLCRYIRGCLDKKKLIRVKDVEYDSTIGKLTGIPGLQYNKTSKKYTIKNMDAKKSSVISRLPLKKKTLKKISSTGDKEK